MNDRTARAWRNWTVATMAPDGESNPLGVIAHGSLLVRGGRITWIGRDSDWPVEADHLPTQWGDGRLLTPGLIDCHTHLVFAGDRVADWRLRAAGESYAEIARRGGGILSTVRATRAASAEELFQTARVRMEAKGNEGITTVEIKSGYGLDVATERRMLDVVARLQRESPIAISATLLAAHAVPPEFAGRSDDYVDYVSREVVPACADVCEAIDVFCESIAFDTAQTERVFLAAREFGKGIKVHAEQLTLTGGAQLAARMGAWSADHLEYLDEAGARALAQSGTVATLLPGAYYFLRERQQPPVALLRDLGVPMAVATDYNPGSSPLNSILLAANMAVTMFGLTPEEALVGITRHAARALRREDQIGTLEIGKQADLAIWDSRDPCELVYAIGGTKPIEVYQAGRKLELK